MTGKNPDNPFPESDDDIPSFADVSSQDENEVTVILPEDLTEDVGSELTEEMAGPDPDGAKTGEVFVLLPDGDDSQIPMVETQEVPDVTEEIEGPRLASVYESATASQVALRRENPSEAVPIHAAETEIDPYGEPTEDVMIAEHPTETMSAGDLDDFANEVADDMLVAEGGASRMDHDPIAYDDDGFDDDDPGVYEEESGFAPRRKQGSAFKKIVLSLAALVAIAATGAHFFPEQLGLDPSFDLKEFVMGHVNSLIGGPEVATASGGDDPPIGGVDTGGPDGVEPPPPLALATQETFKSKFKQAIELGFGEVPR